MLRLASYSLANRIVLWQTECVASKGEVMLMVWLSILLACNIKGKWRDYSLNGAQIPADFCPATNDCLTIEQFTLNLDDDLVGDFRLQIGEEETHYIYTLPASAQREENAWSVSVVNTEYTKIAEQWFCDINGRLMTCDINGDEFKFRRSGHP